MTGRYDIGWHPIVGRMRFSLPLACVALLASLAGCTAEPAPPKGPFVSLFNGTDLAGFRVVIDGAETTPGTTFTVRDSVLVISGTPTGYIATRQSFHNFVLRYDWKFADAAGGNSGLLVHIQQTTHQGPWPACIEVQGMQSEHGHILPIGGATGTFSTDRAAITRTVRPGEWNTTEVVSTDGALTSRVNGVEVSKGSSKLTEGPLGWQSEGAEIHLRNIQVSQG
jgi:Domain of Unknown Function (DUF1080)